MTVVPNRSARCVLCAGAADLWWRTVGRRGLADEKTTDRVDVRPHSSRLVMGAAARRHYANRPMSGILISTISVGTIVEIVGLEFAVTQSE